MGKTTFHLAAALCAWSALVLAQVQEAPPAPRFEIRSFVVEGNSILAPEEIEARVASYRGPDRDFGAVQQALESLQDAYVERGFNAVRVLVPEQDLVQGQVRLQVIEARLADVKVEGNKFFDSANVRQSLPALRVGEPPNTRALSQNIQLVNENPAKQVTVVLDRTDDGTKANAIVRVADDDPSRVTLFVDNTGTPQTGMLRAGAGYQHANLTGADDVLNVQYITSPAKMNDVKIIGVGYRRPVYRWGGAFDVVAGYSDVNSGSVQNLFTVSGSGTIFGLRYTQTLPNIDAYQQKLSVGWDYRAFRQNVALLGTTGTLVPDITVRPLSLAYTGRLSRVGSDVSFFASFSRNLPGGNDGNQNAFTLQRAGAPAKYEILRMGASWAQALPADFLFRAVGQLQHTKDPLVPGEQFGLGGQDSVRGFYEREAANDTGQRISAELYGPDFGSVFGTEWKARLLGFIDAASGRDEDPQRSAANGLSSVGLGLRVNRGRAISLRLDAALVQNRSPSRPDNDGRIHFSFAYAF